MTRRPATLWLLLVAGSGYLAAGCAADVDRSDLDGDGVLNEEDCGPQNAEVYPGAPDPYGDDVDADCDGYDGVDGDGDGYPSNVEDRVAYAHLQDCDDDDASIHPGA